MTFLAPAPRYFMTAAWDTNTEMAPAMKKAGTRHSSTCSWAYHLTKARDSMTAPLKRLLSIGSQKNSKKTPAITANGFQMLCQSIMEGGASSASASRASSSCEFLFAVAEILLIGPNLPGSSGARLRPLMDFNPI